MQIRQSALYFRGKQVGEEYTVGDGDGELGIKEGNSQMINTTFWMLMTMS
jgi:hypothetical protein